jgi:hypothetical protein
MAYLHHLATAGADAVAGGAGARHSWVHTNQPFGQATLLWADFRAGICISIRAVCHWRVPAEPVLADPASADPASTEPVPAHPVSADKVSAEPIQVKSASFDSEPVLEELTIVSSDLR